MVYLSSKAPENRLGPQKGKDCLPTISFNGWDVGFREGMPNAISKYTVSSVYILHIMQCKISKSKPKHKKSIESLWQIFKQTSVKDSGQFSLISTNINRSAGGCQYGKADYQYSPKKKTWNAFETPHSWTSTCNLGHCLVQATQSLPHLSTL